MSFVGKEVYKAKKVFKESFEVLSDYFTTKKIITKVITKGKDLPGINK